MIDKQRAFNKVYRHFARWSWQRCWDAGEEWCVYIREDGHRCAVGVLLPAWVVASLPANLPLHEPDLDPVCRYMGWSSADRRWLGELQVAHDQCASGGLRISLIEFAKRHRLTVPHTRPPSK